MALSFSSGGFSSSITSGIIFAKHETIGIIAAGPTVAALVMMVMMIVITAAEIPLVSDAGKKNMECETE